MILTDRSYYIHSQRLLSPKGAFYMVVVNENKPDDIREIMKHDGFDSSVMKTLRSFLFVCWN